MILRELTKRTTGWKMSYVDVWYSIIKRTGNKQKNKQKTNGSSQNIYFCYYFNKNIEK